MILHAPYLINRYETSIEEIKKQTKKLATNIGVIGLINIQFAIQGKNIYVLEVNPRASGIYFFFLKLQIFL